MTNNEIMSFEEIVYPNIELYWKSFLWEFQLSHLYFKINRGDCRVIFSSSWLPNISILQVLIFRLLCLLIIIVTILYDISLEIKIWHIENIVRYYTTNWCCIVTIGYFSIFTLASIEAINSINICLDEKIKLTNNNIIYKYLEQDKYIYLKNQTQDNLNKHEEESLISNNDKIIPYEEKYQEENNNKQNLINNDNNSNSNNNKEYDISETPHLTWICWCAWMIQSFLLPTGLIVNIGYWMVSHPNTNVTFILAIVKHALASLFVFWDSYTTYQPFFLMHGLYLYIYIIGFLTIVWINDFFPNTILRYLPINMNGLYIFFNFDDDKYLQIAPSLLVFIFTLFYPMLLLFLWFLFRDKNLLVDPMPNLEKSRLRAKSDYIFRNNHKIFYK
ncbi:uncharacterized protein CMU_042400 [Cryptosporidium muris RN66]|uniref:Transmembrane protein n=1 Tax=Cryptosporidium muris (strain RN66) TaxID=441375 RepID=B6AAC6_CRYMR|nr:uncharacterized protein CMU_042400 [Cryptosporidium muris RN66]EEA05167.1 hypothetical protein, conserved [Cryptosporidium muris RN66]|eukprot:XP_002139516.1 hypothetical protein [Cryptosporidium muris RN66]